MVRRRYPRQGQRLAPTMLRELLQIPVPAELLARGDHAGLLLCDLDKRTWERFDESTCHRLGREVVRAVGLAIRASLVVETRPVPSFPEGMTLDDLELETRTINCLIAAGMQERLQDLRGMTLGGVLGLQGFWAKSLVDLLVSLEEACEQSVEDRPRQVDHPIDVKWRDDGFRYPHPRRALAPQTLREVLLGEIPKDLPRSSQWRGTRLCDLDESTWEHFPPQAIEELVTLVVDNAARAGHHRTLRDRPVPLPPPGLCLEDLCLETRTKRCLTREGYGTDLQRLGELTIGKLMAFRAFGAKCLLDLLSAIEASVANYGHFDEDLTAAVEGLAAISGAETITFADPRLGGALRSMDSESNTLLEMCDRLRNRRLDPHDPHRTAQQLRDLHAKITAMANLPVEEECLGICAPDASARDRRIIAEHFGWDGCGQRTLEQLGNAYGLSRERIRQICTRLTRCSQGKVFSPVMNRAISFLAQRVPAQLDALQAALDAEGFSACRIRIDMLTHAASLLDCSVPFVTVEVGGGRVVVPSAYASFPAAILHAASRPTFMFGVASMAELAELVAERKNGPMPQDLIGVTLEAWIGDCWLDAQRTWFRLPGAAQSNVRSTLRKVLAVIPSIAVDEFREMLLRQRRARQQSLPPASVFLEYCRRMPNIKVCDDRIYPTEVIDRQAALTNVEYKMWSILTENGGVLDRISFEKLSGQQGINRSTFNAALLNSPIIRSFGRAVFGLIGAAPDPEALQGFLHKKRSVLPSGVLRGFGRKDDGVAILAYRLSRAAIACGVVTVPAAIRPFLAGTYTLCSVDGRKLGTLVTRDGCGWGIGSVLRREKVREGDHIVLMLDAAKGEAQIQIGDESLLTGLPIA